MERKLWTCKFCSQTETTIVAFARHILKHYTAQHKNMCEVCKKTFGSKKVRFLIIIIKKKLLIFLAFEKPHENRA